MSDEFEIRGSNPYERGIVKCIGSAGYDGDGIPRKQYEWVQHPLYKGRHFEATDKQIEMGKQHAELHLQTLIEQVEKRGYVCVKKGDFR